MNRLEARLGEACREAADTVRPESVRTLDLGYEPAPQTSGGRRGPRRVLGPLAAAAAVALIAAGVVVVPRLIGAAPISHGHRHRPGPASATGPLAALPKFTAVIDGNGLRVLVTATGRVAGLLSPPAGQSFFNIVGTARDRTFYVATSLESSATCETFFYRFTLNAAGRPSALTPLAVPKLPGLPTSLAANAAGSLVAYSVVQCASGGPSRIPPGQPIGAIGLIDLAVGRITRQWSYTLGEDYTNDLSMSAGGHLLGYSNYQGQSPVGRALPVTAPSGPDQRRSHIVVRDPSLTALSASGAEMYALTSAKRETLAAYDAATGRLVRALHQWPSGLNTEALVLAPAGHYLLLPTVPISHRKLPLTKFVRGHPCLFVKVHGKLMCRQSPPRFTDFITVNVATGRTIMLPFRLAGEVSWGKVAW